MASGSAQRIATVQQAGAWLESLINFERQPGFKYSRLGLESIERLLDRLDHPEKSLSVIHVAGSKGKGSTCLLAEAILLEAGERTGTFTSPHLERWSERFRIEGREVADSLLAEAVEIVRPEVEALKKEDPANAPTFFDATTAVALLLFAQQGVSQVLLEVGLGGRLDSTNIVSPLLTCITQIELEHTDKLGGTLAEIASEKAGILKRDAECVAGRLPAEAEAVVVERARLLGVALSRLGREFFAERIDSDAWSAFSIAPTARQAFIYSEADGYELAVGLGVLGSHQIDNAALAIATLKRAKIIAPGKFEDAVRRALSAATLPGRLEWLSDRPGVLVDSAHTPASAEGLRRVLDQVSSGHLRILLSVSSDKDAEAILRPLINCAETIWLTRAEPIRSQDPEILATLCRDIAPETEIRVISDPEQAVRMARDGLEGDDLLCCAGSVYLAGIARRVLGADPRPPEPS